MTKIDKLILQGSVDLDDLEDRDSYEFSFHEVKAALAMLRQQAAEIEALKRGNEATAKLNYNKGHEDGRKFATVKELTLSNTELVHMWRDAIRKAVVEDGAIHTFLTEAILRKAQEK